MYFRIFTALVLSLTSLTDAYKYKFLVKDTTQYDPFPLPLLSSNDKFRGQTLQLRKDGSEYNVVLDNKSPVLFAGLKKGQLRAFELVGKGSKVHYAPFAHAGLRLLPALSNRKTNVSEVYFSTKPTHGQHGFELFYSARSRGNYFLEHNAPLPRGVQEVGFGCALCPRNGGEYQQLVFVETANGNATPPAKCDLATGYTILAPPYTKK